VNFLKEKISNFKKNLKKTGVFFNYFFKKKEKDENLDRNLIYSLSTSNIPDQKQIKHLGKMLSKKEKIIILIASLLVLFSLVYLANVLYNRYWQSFPQRGGSYTEGVLGFPRYINPLYNLDRDIDSDLSYLIYSRLFTYDDQGNLIGDLVSNWEISENKLEYTLNLREGVKWHEGGLLTADDVLFTFYLMKNPEFRSPWQANLTGIELEKINDYQIKFILQEPYAPFFDLLTFGILPKFAWINVNPDFILLSDLNLKPIGSGPFKFKSITKNTTGEVKEYRLVANLDYYGPKPYLEELVFKFYFNFPQLIEALNNKEIDGLAYLPPYLKEEILARNSFNFLSLAIPDINILLLNQDKKNILENKDVRQALALALNRDQLIEKVLFGYGEKVDGPLPPNNLAYNSSLPSFSYNLEEAESLLLNLNWEKVKWQDLDDEENKEIKEKIFNFSKDNELELNSDWLINKEANQLFYINLTISNNYENLELAELIQTDWGKLGIKTIIKDLDAEKIREDVLVNKDFEVLLQKQVIGADPDISAFWHSSQRQNGLNLIDYNNQEVDSLLSDARQESLDSENRINKYYSFQEIIAEELPAIFLFSSNYLYIQNKKIKGFSGEILIKPQYRFFSSNDWYTKTKKRFIR
jgi:peptide/nickel transport system substrate-binding protein